MKEGKKKRRKGGKQGRSKKGKKVKKIEWGEGEKIRAKENNVRKRNGEEKGKNSGRM